SPFTCAESGCLHWRMMFALEDAHATFVLSYGIALHELFSNEPGRRLHETEYARASAHGYSRDAYANQRSRARTAIPTGQPQRQHGCRPSMARWRSVPATSK